MSTLYPVYPNGDNILYGLPVWLSGKESTWSAGDSRDICYIPGSGRSPAVGDGNPLQYLAWKVPWTEEPGRLQSMRWQRVRHD